MNEMPTDALHPAAAGLAGAGILNRLGKLKRFRKRAKKSPVREKSPRPPRLDGITSFLKSVLYVVLFIAYLIVEVVLAMSVYMYLNLYHLDTFGRLVGLSRELLNILATHLENLSPELAIHANATILGELGAKSILLLFIGLIVSALVRMSGWFLHNFLVWFFHKSVEVVRPEQAQSS